MSGWSIVSRWLVNCVWLIVGQLCLVGYLTRPWAVGLANWEEEEEDYLIALRSPPGLVL